MARVEVSRVHMLRECIRGVSLLGFAGLVLWMICVFVSRLLQWWHGLVYAFLVEPGDDRDCFAAAPTDDGRRFDDAVSLAEESRFPVRDDHGNWRGRAAPRRKLYTV